MFLDRCIICLHQNLFLFFFSLSLNCVDEVRFLGRKCNLELWNNLFCDQRILYTHELLLICCFLSLTSFYFYFYFFVIFFCLQTHEYVCYSHSRFYHYISCLLVWINGHTYTTKYRLWNWTHCRDFYILLQEKEAVRNRTSKIRTARLEMPEETDSFVAATNALWIPANIQAESPSYIQIYTYISRA